MNNSIPEGWKETTLGEVAEITSSKRIFANEYLASGIPFYRGKEIIEKYNGNEVSTELYIHQEKFMEIKEKFGAPKAGDILLTSVGTLGIPYIVKENEEFYFKDGNLTWFRNFIELESKFLFYWIISDLGKEQIAKNTIGSTQQALTIVALKNLSILLPPLPEQKAIAEVLSSFDNKIELLREQNKTLEAFAQTIFNEWFVRFNFPDENGKPYQASGGKMIDSELGPIPEGWRVGKLGEFSSLKSGFAFKGEDFIDKSNVKVIKIKDIVGKGSVDLQKLNFVRDSVINDERILHYKLFPGDIVLAMSGNTTGKIGVIPATDDNIFLNQRVGKFFLKEQSFRNFLYLFLMSGDYELKIANMGYGSAQPNINPSQIENISLFIPPVKITTSFENTIKSIMQKSLTNISQIQTLSTLREELLQKLMKGEIRVKGYIK